MCFRRARLDTCNEARTDPDRLCAPRQVRRETTPVVHRARTDDVDGLASQRRLATLARVDAGRDENGRGDVAGVTTTLTRLCADEVDASVESLCDMLRVADHLGGSPKS